MSKIRTIGEIAQLVKEGYKPNPNENLRYIGLEHISPQTLSLNGVGESKDLESNKLKFSSGDILFGKLRPYFRKVCRIDFDGVCSTDIWVIRPIGKVDPDYLFYLFASDLVIKSSTGASTGTRMPRASWEHVSKIGIEVPDYESQVKMGKILRKLDQKIELNRQMNETLEKMGQSLFDSSFTHGKESEKWPRVSIGEAVEIKGGGTPSTKDPTLWGGDIVWTSPRDLSGKSDVYLLDTEKTISEKGLSKISSGLLSEGTLLLSSRAPIGYIAIVGAPLAINQGYIAFLPKAKLPNYFMFFWLKANMEKVKSAANGSTFKEISKTAFRTIGISLPPTEKLKVFEKAVQPIFIKLQANQREVTSLIKLRDTLLPQLISGRVDL